MATSYTTNARLQKPATADRNWDVPINANADLLDGMTAIGGLAVATAESPSTTLNVSIAPGDYRKADGTVGTFGGSSSVTFPASSTTCLWLTDAGVPTQGAAFPASAHVRLASVTTGPTTVLGVTDQRIQCATSGQGLGFLLKSGDAIPDGAAFSIGTSTGAQIGTAADQMLGFFGTAPATQAPRVPALSDTTGGSAGGGVTDVGAAFNQANLNANFASLTATINALIAALKRHGLMAS